MTIADREGVGVSEGPKKDDVIYEQPLMFYSKLSNLHLTKYTNIDKM